MSIKLDRLSSIFSKEISKIINFDIKDSNITMVSVTDVKISSDLSYAKVYISMVISKNKNTTIQALNKAKGFIKSELSKRIKVRKIPDLEFIYDDSLDKGQKIEEILKRVNKGE